jgi:predicted SAM-dependent methyltransferase
VEPQLYNPHTPDKASIGRLLAGLFWGLCFPVTFGVLFVFLLQYTLPFLEWLRCLFAGFRGDWTAPVDFKTTKPKREPVPMIELQKREGDKIIELGCGENPHPQADIHVDVRPIPGVTDFVCDLEHPLPIASDEFAGVLAQYVLEHLSYAKVPDFLKECFRILKPGGMAVFATPDFDAQTRWAKAHPDGWDGKPYFAAYSELIFGTQNYVENSHKSLINQATAEKLFADAGFADIKIDPYNERDTDMVIQARKPLGTLAGIPVVKSERVSLYKGVNVIDGGLQIVCSGQVPGTDLGQESKIHFHCAECRKDFPESELQGTTNDGKPLCKECYRKKLLDGLQSVPAKSDNPAAKYTREELFDKHYFGGGGKVGGYAREGMWDFPVHECTFRHVMARKPQSVLELGAARGYIGKRIQDAGVPWTGLEISKHCYMTRVADGIVRQDLCTSWPFGLMHDGLFYGPQHDLCFSIATLEHVPEEYLPAVIGEMQRTCKRGLHGIDFGEQDDGFDRTHCTLRDKAWWYEQFSKHAPGWPVEVVNKEELERSTLPESLFAGDGKVKLNIGSFTTMHHHGWINVDVHDLIQFAQQHQYKYLRADVRQGLPFKTGEVDLIMCCHMLEHLTYGEGLSFLRECRRMLKPDGAMRIVCPDAWMLSHLYIDPEYSDNFNWHTKDGGLNDYDEINDGAANSPTTLGKLWALLFAGHQAAYDGETLMDALSRAGFEPKLQAFRQGHKQILAETLDMLPSLSIYVDAIPQVVK